MLTREQNEELWQLFCDFGAAREREGASRHDVVNTAEDVFCAVREGWTLQEQFSKLLWSMTDPATVEETVAELRSKRAKQAQK